MIGHNKDMVHIHIIDYIYTCFIACLEGNIKKDNSSLDIVLSWRQKIRSRIWMEATLSKESSVSLLVGVLM